MDIGILALCFGVGLLDGLILGLALAIWIVKAGGHDWNLIKRRWRTRLEWRRYRRYRSRIEAGLNGG